MDDIKNTMYWEIFKDAFNLMKQSFPVTNNEEYWDKIVEKSDQLCKKYENTDQGCFAKEMIMNVVFELDHINSQMLKRGEAS